MPQKRILIVEDEGITAMGIQRSLEDMGYEVAGIVSTGKEAVEKAGNGNVDLVLMDVILSGAMDGIEAARMIRSHNVPVVYLTAQSDERVLEQIKETAPFGYIVKPFDDRELRMAVEIALYKHDTEAELKRHRNELMHLVEERTAELQRRNEELNNEIFERKKTESLARTANALLKLFPQKTTKKEYLDSVVEIFRSWSGVTCLGIRVLNDLGEIPYDSYKGFDHDFWCAENHLNINTDQCVCTRVITGHSDPGDMPAMTKIGSFFCNDTFRFVGNLSDEEKTRYRGECVRNGYASIAVVPVRVHEKTVAVIHFADEQKEMVPRELIEAIESMTPMIGEAVYRFDVEEELQEYYEKIKNANELLEKVFSNMHVLIAYMDRDFNFIRVNRRYAEADGREPEFYVGKNHFDLFPNKENEDIFRRVAERGEPYSVRAKAFEYAYNPERGTTYWDWSLMPVKEDGGGTTGLVLSLIDVTENINLYSELMRSEQLASIGRLAAGIAHEVNNPINGIINYAQIIASKCPPDSREDDIALRIIKESDRIAGIVRSLLSFAHDNKGARTEVNIDEALADSLVLTETQLRKNGIILRINIPPDLPPIFACKQQIEQVILNMISNAHYALNKKYPEDDEHKVLEISGEKINEGDVPYVRIMFYDSGTGIPEGIIKRLTEPFFSTKPEGEGTGLGLSICHGIIKDHNGVLRIESQENKFTRVLIDLPAAVRA